MDDALQSERATSQALQIRINSLGATVNDLSDRSEQQQRAISLLVSEKTTLTASLERLQDAESGASNLFEFTHTACSCICLSALQETSVQLGQERGRAEHLQRTVHQLEAEGRESAERIAQLSASEKELADKAREQVGTFLSDLSLFALTAHHANPFRNERSSC